MYKTRLAALSELPLHSGSGFRYIPGRSAVKGSLAPGKLADFIVVDRDVLGVPTDELKDVKVLQSWVGGQQIYGKASLTRTNLATTN